MLLFNKNRHLPNKMILSTNQSILTTVQDPEQVLIKGSGGGLRGVNGDSPPQKNMAPCRAAGGAHPSGSAPELFYQFH